MISWILMNSLLAPIPLWHDLPEGPSAIKPFGYAAGYDMDDPRWREPLVHLADHGLLIKSWYAITDGSNPPYNRRIDGAIDNVLLRESAAKLCVQADRLVQDLGLGLRLLFVDGYRSQATQKGLWDFYQADIKQRRPDLEGDALHKETMIYISYGEMSPDDPNSWFVHSTGGSIDVLLYDPGQDAILECGVAFDDSTPVVFTDHYERLLQTDEITNQNPVLLHRRILRNAMVQSGFTNYPYEYFHFDYGTILHSAVNRILTPGDETKAWYGMATL